MRRIFCVLFLLASPVVVAQTEQQPSTPEIADDTNPTKAVFFSLREEYYNFRSNSWNNLLIFRADPSQKRAGEDNRTSFRSGIQLGRMFNSKIGFWIKPEIHWGNNREADWVLKFTMILAK